MTRKVDVDDLVSVSEIAERLHLKNASLIHTWRRRYEDFPAPVARLRIGSVWAFRDVESVGTAAGTRPGRLMGQKVDVEDLVSAAEVGARLGFDRNVVHTWLRRYPTFPRPVATLAIGHVWSWEDIEKWAAETGRRL